MVHSHLTRFQNKVIENDLARLNQMKANVHSKDINTNSRIEELIKFYTYLQTFHYWKLKDFFRKDLERSIAFLHERINIRLENSLMRDNGDPHYEKNLVILEETITKLEEMMKV